MVRSLSTQERLRVAIQVAVDGTPDLPVVERARVLRRLADELDPAGTASPTGAEMEFRRAGDAWIVTFEGLTVAIRHLAGMPYIAFLLANPGQTYSPLALEAHVNGTYVPSSATRLTADDRRQLIEQRRQLETWAASLAEGHEDLPRIREASNEIERRLRGGFDEATDEFETARKRILVAVRGAMKVIRQHHGRLWEHLSRHLAVGAECSYR